MSDIVVAEMLQEAPENVFGILAALFGLHLINHPAPACDDI